MHPALATFLTILYISAICAVVAYFAWPRRTHLIWHDSGEVAGLAYGMWSRKPSFGLTVQVPVHVPHIYLDSTSNDRSVRTGQWLHFDEKFRISLEGDFDQRFLLYAHPQNRILALSIISPDVMQAILQAAPFDIEIGSNTINLLVRRGQRMTPELHAAMLQAAALLATEVDHRLRSWRPHGEAIANMPYTLDHSLKFGRHRITGLAFMSWLAYLLFTVLAWLFALIALGQLGEPPQSATAQITKVTFALLTMPIAPGAFILWWQSRSPDSPVDPLQWWQHFLVTELIRDRPSFEEVIARNRQH